MKKGEGSKMNRTENTHDLLEQSSETEELKVGEIPKIELPSHLKEIFYTNEEVAKMLKINTATLARWRKDKKGPDYMLMGRTIIYPLSSINSFLDQAKVKLTNAVPETWLSRESERKIMAKLDLIKGIPQIVRDLNRFKADIYEIRKDIEKIVVALKNKEIRCKVYIDNKEENNVESD
jgi:hypothetical protein